MLSLLLAACAFIADDEIDAKVGSPGAGLEETGTTGTDSGTDSATEAGPDRDADGYVDAASGGDDCDDADASVHPGAREVCDGANTDEDCDGAADDADDEAFGGTVVFDDDDGDSFGADGSGAERCDSAPGAVTVGGDCDDADPTVHPGATEWAGDTLDQDCDGDEYCYVDEDGDAYGGDGVVATEDIACAGSGLSARGGDCDDADAARSPGRAEVADDGVDGDCDGWEACYADVDGDGHGSSTLSPSPDLVCRREDQESGVADDCSDGSAAIHPGAAEIVANGLDDDCDGADACYRDADGDGWGGSSTVSSPDGACRASDGESTLAADCDDTNDAVHPGAEEVIGDEVDEDCDGGETCFRDLDGDGYGAGTLPSEDTRCEPGDLEATAPDDCDDADAAQNPGAEERCNEVDDNCDGAVDEGETCEVPDTGFASFGFVGSGEVIWGAWMGGEFGFAWTDVGDPGIVVCDELGDWSYVGDVTASCADCEWAFTLAMSETVERTGPACDSLPAIDAVFYYDYEWGFAEAYDLYGDGSWITPALMLGYGGYWYAWAAEWPNYPEFSSIEGSASSFAFTHALNTYPYVYTYAFYRSY